MITLCLVCDDPTPNEESVCDRCHRGLDAFDWDPVWLKSAYEFVLGGNHD
jgi:hypothetical protein